MPSPATVPLPKTTPPAKPETKPAPSRTTPAPMKPFERPAAPSEDPLPNVEPCRHYPTCELTGLVLPPRASSV